MHYTSIENIHKVIDPLFLDDLREELDEIKKIQVLGTQKKKLKEYQKKLAGLVFFDPACGSGNFLTETYLSLRRIENEVLQLIVAADSKTMTGQITFGFQEDSPIQVSIHQFYGIEINDFAVSVAQTALWIAESQTMKETEDIVHQSLDFFPLKTYKGITEGNALQIDWAKVVPVERLSYIMGNPPFVGYTMQTKEQKEDLAQFTKAKNLDYVAGWYFKAVDLMSQVTGVRTAFVSTNSITQGEQVGVIWKPLIDSGVCICFAHRTFIWDSEATDKAHVHCVIIGFTYAYTSTKTIYDGESIINAENISPYLVDAPSIIVDRINKPICDVPELGIGNMPIDDGNYLFSLEEKEEFIKKEPRANKYFHLWLDSRGFINNKKKYCLYIGNCTPAEIKGLPAVMERVEKVRDFRMSSKRTATLKMAEYPTKFATENIPSSSYIAIPEVSSERRRYIPMGFLSPNVLCSNKLRITQEASLYHFGILTSNVHMSWTRAICGRLKSDYDYSIKLVYNAFPWPNSSSEQKEKIEKTAQGILDARALYPDSSLADLYDPLTMPPELRKAHQLNDKAVMQAYGMPIKETDEAACVAWLMKLYQEKVNNME